MLAVLTVCHREIGAANKLIDWMAELGGCARHEILLAVTKRMAFTEAHLPMMEKLRGIFGAVRFYEISPEDERPGPESMPHVYAANNSFIRIQKDVINDLSDTPFLWLETDAIPLTADWLDRIEAEYNGAGMPFMGARVLVDNVPEHMSGVAVYRGIGRHAPDYVTAQNNAWDVVAAHQIVPKAHFTRLIQHDWRPAPFETAGDLSRIRPGAVLYHQDKKGFIIDRLRESRGGVSATRPPLITGEIAGASPAPATATPAPVKRRRGRPGKVRTPEQIEAAKARMEKVRAARKVAA